MRHRPGVIAYRLLNIKLGLLSYALQHTGGNFPGVHWDDDGYPRPLRVAVKSVACLSLTLQINKPGFFQTPDKLLAVHSWAAWLAWSTLACIAALERKPDLVMPRAVALRSIISSI